MRDEDFDLDDDIERLRRFWDEIFEGEDARRERFGKALDALVERVGPGTPARDLAWEVLALYDASGD
jgi:hypothetical protein